MTDRRIQAYSIEPNADRNKVQLQQARERGVTVCPGSMENIPFSIGAFDAAVAMWVLHYVDDLDKALPVIARVGDPKRPYARIVIMQGAPDTRRWTACLRSAECAKHRHRPSRLSPPPRDAGVCWVRILRC
ncbi:hypothetical protein BJX96DRAFT_158180 [Aspergillus floccosus]